MRNEGRRSGRKEGGQEACKDQEEMKSLFLICYLCYLPRLWKLKIVFSTRRMLTVHICYLRLYRIELSGIIYVYGISGLL